MLEPTAVLPGSDVEVPMLGLGTWAWGDKSTWGMGGYDRSYGPQTIQEAYERSVVAGVTLLDTAEAYGGGESERIIGRLLEEDRGNRARIVVATKFLPFPWKISLTSSLMAALEASLERLRMRFVHLYQIHGPISLRSHRAMAAALAAARGRGLIKAVGVSNYSEREVRSIHAELAVHGIPLATNQIEFSLLRRRPEASGLLRACRELGVLVLAYSPIAQGRLSGRSRIRLRRRVRPLHVGTRFRLVDLPQARMERAIVCSWISFVPPPISNIFASRISFSTGRSAV